MKKSNVTVIIPCFNDGDYIEKAVNSILNQTLQAERIIIIDDGSDLYTKGILKNFNNELINVVYQDNQGVCVSRNKAIELANTKYILNLDSDDYFEHSFLQKAVDILENNPKVGVVGSFYKCFGSKEKQGLIVKPLGGSISNFLLYNNGVASSLFRKKCWEDVKGYDELMINGYEDWEFWIAILSKNWEMFIIQEVLFNYRIKKISRDKVAINKFDYELKEYIFFKHKKVFVDNFELYVLELLGENCELKKSLKCTKSSKSFILGDFILNIFKFKLFKKLKL